MPCRNNPIKARNVASNTVPWEGLSAPKKKSQLHVLGQAWMIENGSTIVGLHGIINSVLGFPTSTLLLPENTGC